MTTTLHPCDVVVIGGGVAGAAIAAFLAPWRRVVVLEREAPAGRHATGRSSGMLLPSYGGEAARPLSRASLRFFAEPPGIFGGDLLTPRPTLHVAGPSQIAALAALAGELPGARLFGPTEAARRAPLLRAGRLAGALLEAEGGDIDVARLHAGFLAACRRSGGQVHVGVGDLTFARRGSVWRVSAGGVTWAAPVIVNAAGAWADEVARAAGAAALGLQPKRRTVLLFPRPPETAGWPTVKDVDERFYFRPCSKALLFTACDETPSPPCDAQPETLDVAHAAALFSRLSRQPEPRPIRAWAGLRTFAPDRAPVIGWSSTPGFFWFAGLGGFGVQTSPAAGSLAASLLLGRRIPGDLLDAGVRPELYAPTRLTSTGAARTA
ncbi:NAD(P)/FAD-dependent oxidoreductase [Phenylobacterium zucineum]|nr:FAD-dependent oxidoreductase [Phenylobacterium zucineum]